MDKPLIIVQITDLHILAEEGLLMAGVETEKTFKQVLEHIHLTYHSIDLLLVTGDLVQNASQASYQRIFQALKNYSTPTVCLPGNHDDTDLMLKIIADKQVNCNKQSLFKSWHIICLNSKKPNANGGYLASSELTYLANALEKEPLLNTLIAVHHHPIPTESIWMDTMTIENSDELFAILKNHPQVKAISCGHIHQEIQSKKDNILIFGTPSTCFQFKPLSESYAVDDDKPGYRVFSLLSDGSVKSTVIRLPSEKSPHQ